MIGWRKFSLAAFALVAGTVLAWNGKLEADFVGLASLVLGTYGIANVAAKKVSTKD